MVKTYKTEIMATAGPTMEEVNQLEKAIHAGARSFRINMGLRTRNLYGYFKNIRQASKNREKKVDILIDMPTSRPRIGKMNPMELNAGDFVTIVDKKEVNFSEKLTIPLEGLMEIVPVLKVGHRVLFRDGKVTFIVKKIVDEKTVQLECMKATTILMPLGSSTFPDSDVTYKPLVQEDFELFDKLSNENLVPDYVSLSFSSDAEQVRELRKVVNSYWKDSKVKIIAKIETKKGLKNFEEILNEVDGVMVARGDLLLNIPAYILPKVQQDLVRRTNLAGKISIVATEMFEHFAVNGVVNRAELSDIALAVRQQANAVMLSRETGNSNFPIETIELIQKIIEEEYSFEIPFLN